MATSGGTPPTGVGPKPKREVTPEQKRTYIGLGVVGVLALVVAVIYVPGMLSGSSNIPTAPPTAPATNGAAGGATNNAAANTATTVPTGGPGIGGGAGAGTTVPDVSGAGSGQSSSQQSPPQFVADSRIDPFQPVLYTPPIPPPDPQFEVPQPAGFNVQLAPGTTLPKGGFRSVAPLPALNIGSPNIPRLDSRTTPRDAFPLPRTGGNEGGTGVGTPQLSYDKRLAGVVIGDGVRALLELPSGEERVVQPGDEVEGIRVLNIEQIRQGDGILSRMLIRDTDGSQKYVELKSSPNPPGNVGGAGDGSEGGGFTPGGALPGGGALRPR